ncbi:MAG TPA: diacylglycerol kinase family lipid kinase [Nitrospirae bacterium]|nr:diacylglycerol kinase [bacterium BMS3Abin10]GBE38835.1 diacylglycerol kinase [bacterium BMS3Bbin08]HDH50502.1 diacylglycerol kinase family lipid kinase [Nitrospirota bacterium]HDK16533.1 diacylglycerol kinase family lipid kinase [Nitrospirota bacterium]HDK41516.1 diacylglycerol kinase family lipid kinase [Nitrospirota bacterium]
MDFLNVSLVANPAAGRLEPGDLEKIENTLRKRVYLTSFTTRKKGDALLTARELTGSDLVIVAGGDGTLNEVINGLMTSRHSFLRETPVALLPLGTANVLAGELRVPVSINEAIDLALTGAPMKIALGRINDRYFALMAGIGFDGETVYRVKDSVKDRWGKGAYILSGLNVLRKYRPPLIKVKTPEETLSGYTAVIGNAQGYAGKFQVTPMADMTRPRLDLCLFQGRSRISMLRFILGVVRKKHLDFKDVVYRQYSQMEVTSDEYVHIQIDGDYFGTLPARIDVVRDAVSIVC